MSNPEFQTIYAVYRTIDGYGRKGNLHGYYARQEDAVDASKSIGFWGMDGVVEAVTAIRVGDQLYHLESDRPITFKDKTEEHIAAEALKKLNKQERRALGL